MQKGRLVGPQKIGYGAAARELAGGEGRCLLDAGFDRTSAKSLVRRAGSKEGHAAGPTRLVQKIPGCWIHAVAE